MSRDDGPVDLEAYRRARQERADQALICMFASVLGAPLVLRELTPEQRKRREARLVEVRARREQDRSRLSS